jgi:hypothetical protein
MLFQDKFIPLGKLRFLAINKTVAIVFLAMLFLVSRQAYSQTDSAAATKQAYQKILHSKHNITSSIMLSKHTPGFLDRNLREGSWDAVTWHSQWAEVAYANGSFKRNNDSAIYRGNEFHAALYFPLNTFSLGSRLYDIHGMLLVPAVSVGYSYLNLNKQITQGIRLSPSVSLQFPFFGIEARLNTDYRFNPPKSLKQFSVYPEIGIRIDGLYNLMDPQSVYIGHAEGTITSRNTSYSTSSHRDGNYIVTTTYRTETTTVTPYSIDRYIKSVGAFLAVGPRFTFKDVPYAGQTRLYGLGYYIRTGAWSSDLLVDYGKAGFASSLQNPQNIENPGPAIPKINRDDKRMTGHYNVWRAQIRYGLDLIELYASAFGNSVVASGDQVKFSRITGGFGFGYASISAPHYDSQTGANLADSIYNTDFTLLATSRNNARLAQSGPLYSFYLALEAGCIQINFERTFYSRAALASINTVTVAYLFPYNRIYKKNKAIRSYKNYIKTH